MRKKREYGCITPCKIHSLKLLTLVGTRPNSKVKEGLGGEFREAWRWWKRAWSSGEAVKRWARMAWGQKLWLSRSEPLKVAQSQRQSVWLLSQSHFISLAIGAEPWADWAEPWQHYMSIYGNMTSSSWSLPSLNKLCISCIFFGMYFHLEWPVFCWGTLSPIAAGLASSIYGCRFYLSNVSIRSTQGCSINCRWCLLNIPLQSCHALCQYIIETCFEIRQRLNKD